MIDVRGYVRPASFDQLWDALAAVRGRTGADSRCSLGAVTASPALVSGATKDDDVPVVVCAGCTDLIPRARSGQLEPARWIDIRDLAPLRGITIEQDQLRLGACLTHHQVASSEELRSELPALADACQSVGSRQIRSRGTLGGNAANASPCADSLLALNALDAEIVLRSRDGARQLPLSDFCTGPGSTVLERGEIIEAFVVPRQGRRSVFLKLGPRKAVAVAKVSAATSAIVENGRLRSVRLVMGSVAPIQIRISEAEELLEDKAPDDALLRQVAAIVEKAVKPIDDVRSTADYRRVTSGVLAKRAVAALV